MTELQKTPLHAIHISRGAKMAPFAGFDMPISYPDGVLKEHLHTREAAGLFDVSHMGQVTVRPKSGDMADATAALEALMPMNIAGLAEGRQRYALLTNEAGGIVDDLMVANRGDHFHLVINASRRAEDLALLHDGLDETCDVMLQDRGLFALQGPKAQDVLSRLHSDVANMRFMDVWPINLRGFPAIVARAGYTGEDGYEVSAAPQHTRDLVEWLAGQPEVMFVGLGARDSLRLEAGLCLYGNDIDEKTTPVEAALEWAIQSVRRAGGARAGGFPGAERILDQIAAGAPIRRVGLSPEGRAPMREGVELFADQDGEPIGAITSGGFGPSVGAPVAMGYVPIEFAAPDTKLFAQLRGKMLPVTVAKLPFITPGYKQG